MLEIEKLIDSQPTAFISSSDEDGFPNIKAMLAPRLREKIKTFYFTTNTSSKRVAQYLKNNKASIYFCDNQSFQGIMFKGTIEVLTDPKNKQLVWHEGDNIYYPKGITDPDYCVLKFTAQTARYYHNLASTEFHIQ